RDRNGWILHEADDVLPLLSNLGRHRAQDTCRPTTAPAPGSPQEALPNRSQSTPDAVFGALVPCKTRPVLPHRCGVLSIESPYSGERLRPTESFLCLTLRPGCRFSGVWLR